MRNSPMPLAKKSVKTRSFVLLLRQGVRRLDALLSLKGLVLGSAVLLLLIAGNHENHVPAVGNWLFQISERMASAPTSDPEIALIRLDEDELLLVQQDPIQSAVLPLLLRKDKLIALVLPGAVRERPVQAEQLMLTLPGELMRQSPHLTEWRQQAAKADQLRERIRQGQLLIGLTKDGVSSFPEQAFPVKTPEHFSQMPLSVWLLSMGVPVDWMTAIGNWLQQRVTLTPAEWPVDPALSGAGYRASDSASDHATRQLIWQQESHIHGDLALALYLRYQLQSRHLEQEPSIVFRDGYAIELGDQLLPVNSDGAIVPATLSTDRLQYLSLQQSLRAPPTQPIWIFAASRAQLAEVAATVQALQHRHYFYQPYWNPWLFRVMLLLLCLYAVWIQPLLRRSMALLSVAFIVVILCVAQIAWQLGFKQLLPLPMLIQWFVPASLCMMLWQHRRGQQETLKWDFHRAQYQLAHQFYQQGKLNEALAALAPCYTRVAVTALLYDIAVQQERKRQYQDAALTYDKVMQRNPRFKDAAKRAEALSTLSDSTTLSVDFSGTQSLVMPAQEGVKPVLGRYQIERELGRGAMGTVYLGIDPKISRRVAIKTLSFREFDSDQLERIKERFFREAEAVGRLTHPHIVTVFDVGEEADLAFMAMDYVDGRSLDRCASEGTLLDIEEVYSIVAAVADALHYAHQQNIVHRDIKPGNILYDAASSQIKVADFGIARIVDDSKTKTGDMLGSPVFMSPEQLKGNKVTGASDIYSLGVTFYQLLTGALPFSGDSIANLAYHILNKKYVSVREVRPELSAGVVRVVNKALHREPSRRYANAGEMADAVRGLLSREFGRKAS